MSKIPASLKQKMAQSVVGTGPSLVPVPKPVEVAEEPVAPPITELIAEKEDVDTLQSLVKTQMALNSDKKAIESRLDPINDRIKALLGQYGIYKATCDGASISYSASTRSSINATKLLAAGVEQEIIDSCTDKKSTRTLLITRGKS